MKNHKKVSIGNKIGDNYLVREIYNKATEKKPVWLLLCENLYNGNRVILKLLDKEHVINKQSLLFFKRELMANLFLGYHPFIVECKEIIQCEELLGMTLEYIKPKENEGKKSNLKHYLNEKIDINLFLNWVFEFCEGIEYSKQQGIWPHRDIKPSNILITKEKILKISDFSLAKINGIPDTLKNEKGLILEIKNFIKSLKENKDTSVVGSKPWRAPEIYQGKADERYDVFSFGIVMYQILNKGKMPFSKFMPEYYVVRPKITENEEILNKIYDRIENCLYKNPAHRISTFSELKDRFRNISENAKKIGQNVLKKGGMARKDVKKELIWKILKYD